MHDLKSSIVIIITIVAIKTQLKSFSNIDIARSTFELRTDIIKTKHNMRKHAVKQYKKSKHENKFNPQYLKQSLL